MNYTSLKKRNLLMLSLLSLSIQGESSLFEKAKEIVQRTSETAVQTKNILINSIDNAFFHPKNNDPRFISLTATGCFMSFIGARTLWKGLPLLIYGQKKSAGVNSPGRFSGFIGTVIGSSLLSFSAYVSLNAKDIIAQFDKWKIHKN